MNTILIKRNELIIPLENTLDNLEALGIAMPIMEPLYQLYKICRETNSNITILVNKDVWHTISYYANRPL
jgi:hypothetical protein